MFIDNDILKNLVIFIDPLEGKKIEGRFEISIPKRTEYIGSPTALREPIALEYIASYLEQFNYKILILSKALMKDEEILETINNYKTNLLAICFGLHSTYLVNKTLNLAKKIKSEIPNIPIIVGGYHPTGDPFIVKHDEIDYAVIGEGEETCKELLYVIQSKKNQKYVKKVKGISFIDGENKTIITETRKRLEFSELPIPKRDKKILELSQPGPLSYPHIGKVAQIAFSRGCSNFCDFCVSPKMWGKEIKNRRPEQVVNEMKHLIVNYGINNFFFCDLSFNSNERLILELLKKINILKEKSEFDFGCHVMCTTNKMNEDLLQKMKEANILKIDYGIEDVLQETLSRIKPFQNLNQTYKVLDQTNDCGILIRGLMMVGYPWETKKAMEERKKIIIELPIDQFRICFYVPFPGAKIYRKLKSKIIVGYDDFSTDVPVIKCDGINSETLKNSVYQLFEIFYNSENYIDRIQYKFNKYPELSKSYLTFFSYLKNKNILRDENYFKLRNMLENNIRKFQKVSI